MKKQVAKAQKRTKRNIAKRNERLKGLIHARVEARKEQKFTKDPNRSLRRLWKRVVGNSGTDCPARIVKNK